METLDQLASLKYFLPETILTASALLLFLLGPFLRERAEKESRGRATLVAICGLLASLISLILLIPAGGQSLFLGMVVYDNFAIFFKLFAIGVTLFIVLFTYRSNEPPEKISEFMALLFVVALGMSLMASAVNLLMMYMALELTSVPCYVMAGYHKTIPRSAEAALKYVIYGAVSSGIMLFGFSLLFGLTGETGLFEINRALIERPVYPLALLLAIIFALAGLGYKIASVPFHFWCPDVYEGAPTPCTALFSVGPKAAGFAMMIRFFYTTMVTGEGENLAPVLAIRWPELLAVISAITMSLGNLAALAQRNVKRLLAYSGIAHAGYILMGVVLLNHEGLTASLFYLIVYLFMNLGAFLVVIYLSNNLGSENIEDYKGLIWHSPFVAVAMGVFLVALIGVPPTAGFIGKFYLFAAVVNARLYWLALIGLLNTTVSVYYYARILKAMFLERGTEDVRLTLPIFDQGLLWALIIPILVLGVWWVPAVRLAEMSFQVFRGY